MHRVTAAFFIYTVLCTDIYLMDYIDYISYILNYMSYTMKIITKQLMVY